MTPVDVTIRRTSDRIPPLGIGLWTAHRPLPAVVQSQLEKLAPNHVDVLIDLRRPREIETLTVLLRQALAYGPTIWLYAICADDAPEPGLDALAECLDDTDASIAGLLLTPAAYLHSYQPDGAWPRGASPADLLALARTYWPALALGGGFPTYFTELNRCRPDPERIDFLTHATSPIVHAADDRSVIETLDSLPHIFDSARHIAPGCPYRITTSAIGAWTNPYGHALTPNIDRQRRTLSDNDPRQRGLFAAAWALGYMARAIGRVDSLTLSSIGPPFAVADAAGRFPIHDILRGLNRAAGRPALRVASGENTLRGLGWMIGPDRGELWIGNLSETPKDVHLPGLQAAAVVDDHIAFDALGPDDWPLERLKPRADGALTLAPFAVARVDIRL